MYRHPNNMVIQLLKCAWLEHIIINLLPYHGSTPHRHKNGMIIQLPKYAQVQYIIIN